MSQCVLPDPGIVRWRHEDRKFKVTLSYMVTLRPAQDIGDLAKREHTLTVSEFVGILLWNR